MRLRIPLPTLMAGFIAGCTAVATLLPTTALAGPGPASAPPAASASRAVPKPLGPVVAAHPADAAPVAAPLPPALLGQAVMGLPAGTAVQTTPRPATREASLAEPAPARPGARPHRTATPAAQSCTPADFGSRGGSSLVSYVKGSTTDCVNTLFDVTGTDAGDIFKEQQMLTVANAFQGLAADYTGDDSTGIWQLALFLRAGYYVQSYNTGAVGDYDATLSNAVKAGLDAFFADPHSADVDDDNGSVLYDVLVLTDSANLQADYLDVYQRVLNGYNNSYNAFPTMANAVNAVLFAPLWRANWNPDFVNAVDADPGIVNTLSGFALHHEDLLGGADSFLDVNAGNDLARMAGDGATTEAVARPEVKAVLDSARITGTTGPLYVHTAYQADAFDGARCSYYGTCDLPAKLTAAVLPHTLVCGNRTIETEALSPSGLAAVCRSLEGEDTFFHTMVKDQGPIPGQYDKTVTLAVFTDQADYVTYSWAIFGNSTDNGGETLMDPTDPNNQAVSVMYQKPWNDGFTANVWNLNHEYTHYLDNIYDLKGSFPTETSVPDVWWIEGVAEYESYAYRGTTDTEAMAEAAKHTYKLSTIFQNTYDNSDTVRTYPWGYLAVRYMFEKHPSDIHAMLGHFRTGDYQGGYAVYHAIGTAYDADFDNWLNDCSQGGCYAPGPTARFSQSVNGATVSLTDNSVETGSSARITSWNWTFGDGTSSTLRNPTHTYSAAGTYVIALTVTDSAGKSASTPASVTVTSGGGSTLPTCADPRTDAMGRNCSRANRATTAGNLDYMYIYLPAGTTTLNVSASGGTGTAYLYYNADTWASPTAFTASSTNPGTTQHITVTNTTAGYRYISLYAKTDFSGVTVSTRY
ncbi:collagenase [Streptantibioticus cattleyicolor]|uniref:microbial collagenase n=1 Tax=Streptantibioticus cattleyicolor (strain ATCC 35852 / DSM 46488 / JCM 4925 / NBRC 14057 / NRRL 8057) TaxID=1003195 RepID=F8JLL9_STREN|nr:collagenase [Streptantibioticus cattleyicolor]AEW98250.1 Peptidase M9A collagenase domain protein [Streptantibioticus cattleyicolor NRRL 8057 = DSM 46488]CCB72687.1 PDK repeat-containing protein [Streptantibioticus cattleyicolor NRRL 8057 = DSM 46488]